MSRAVPTLAWAATLGGLLLGWSVPVGAIDRAALAFTLVWLAQLVLSSRTCRNGWRSIPVLYLATFGLFHGGLLLSVSLRGSAGLVLPSGQAWLYGPYLPGAVRLVLLGTVAFGTAVQLAGRGRAGSPPVEGPDTRLAAIGLVVQVFSLAALSGALRSANYNAYLGATSGSTAVAYALLLIGFGTAFAVAGSRAQRRTGIVLFALFAVAGFPLGLRGEVLFPLAVVVAVEARRGRRVPVAAAVPAAFAVLVLIGMVRQTREDGTVALLHTGLSSPLDAVAEMGYSLYPTVVVQQWRAMGEPAEHGMTLVAVPVRLVERVTGWHGGPPEVDYRLFNVEVSSRVGPIGGSPVAEGYVNLGTPGTVLLMGVIGGLLGLVDRRCADGALIAVVALPVVLGIRQALAPLPVQILLGVALLAIGRLRLVRAPVQAVVR